MECKNWTSYHTLNAIPTTINDVNTVAVAKHLSQLAQQTMCLIQCLHQYSTTQYLHCSTSTGITTTHLVMEVMELNKYRYLY